MTKRFGLLIFFLFSCVAEPVEVTGEAEHELGLPGICHFTCNDNNACTIDSCASGSCVHTDVADDAICGGNTSSDVYGRCRSGSCIWTNWTCEDGGLGAACHGDGPPALDGVCTDYGACCYGCMTTDGSCLSCWGVMEGEACPLDQCLSQEKAVDHSDPDVLSPCGIFGCNDHDPCTFDSCATNGCQYTAAPGGTPCVEGQCAGTCFPPYVENGKTYPGECSCSAASCDGCIAYGGTCVTGDNATACGADGGACDSCDDGNDCTVDVCDTFNAPGYPKCGHYMLNNEHTCRAGLIPGKCDGNGSCCIGCFALTSDGPACVAECPKGTTCGLNMMCLMGQ